MHVWMWFQLILHIVLMLYMFNVIGDYSFTIILMYGLFLFLSIFAYTSLMDYSFLAIPFEIAKVALGLGALYFIGSWYNIDDVLPFGSVLMIFYLIVSLCLSIYFKHIESRTNYITA